MRKSNLLHYCCLMLSCLLVSNCSKNNFTTKQDLCINNQSIKLYKTTKSETDFGATNYKYKLVWADEFNKNGAPDTTKWGYDIGTGIWGWGNNEKEFYTKRKENVNIANGILKITAIKEAYNGSDFTSTRMLTKGKFDFKYGKIEARAKLPNGAGTWPAIWMLGSNITKVGWPLCGEIDIMEHKGSELNKIYATLHYPNHSGENGDGHTTMINNATNEFHIYTAEWTKTSILFYVDNVLFKTFINNTSTPFNEKFHIILNLAMGGNFAGSIDATIAKASMEIDYVRVYQ